MKHLPALALLAAAVAAGVPAAHAGTFGLFTCGHCCQNACSPCPRPYNAFSAFPCCAIANAAGCTVFPPAGLDGAAMGGHGHHMGGFAGGPQWYGVYKHWGHARAFGYDMPLPYPCGALAAFTGTPGRGGCGDPFSGCGTKPKHRLHGCFPDSASVPPPGLLGKLKGHGGHGHHIGGGHAVCDGAIVDEPTWTAPLPTAAVPTASAPAAPVYQPVSYQPAYYPGYYPNYYGGYYPNWGHYPAYGY